MPKFRFTIGADPEMLLYTPNGVRLSAVEISDAMEGVNDPSGGKAVPDAGVFGFDGCASTGEIRPLPSNDPKEVTENIGKLLAFAHEQTDGLMEAKTQSLDAPTGGHIHLAIPPDLLNRQKTLATAAVRTLACLAPLLDLDSKETRKCRDGSRSDGSYGCLGDFRCEPKGPNRTHTLEVRCLSAEWLTTPKLTEAILVYLATCWNEALYHPRTFSKRLGKDFIPDSPEGLNGLHKMLRHSPRIFRQFAQRMTKAIRHFETYAENKDLIEYLLDPTAVKADKEQVGYSVAKGWDLDAKVKFSDTDGIPAGNRTTDIILARAARGGSFGNVTGIYLGSEDGLGKYGSPLQLRNLRLKRTPDRPCYLFGLGDRNADAPVLLHYAGFRPDGTASIMERLDVPPRGNIREGTLEKFAMRLVQVICQGRARNLTEPFRFSPPIDVTLENTHGYAIGIPPAWLEVASPTRKHRLIEAYDSLMARQETANVPNVCAA